MTARTICCILLVLCLWVGLFGQSSTDIAREAQYRSPVRYVIIHNDIFDPEDINERRMVVLIDARAFSSKNLIMIAELLKKRFPKPVQFEVEIETSLDLVETPEERELLRDSVDSRFSKYYFKHRRASYFRFETGREVLTYTTTLSPYREKMVVLVNKPAF